ncbi:hypothetical protein FQN49_005782 [Arthroderma sp. PD_2]|nr:hypothetical protein FQN49_005782 [Arthroderma sp. PD_2]
MSGDRPPSSAAPEGLVESPIILRRSEKKDPRSDIKKADRRSKHWDSDATLIRNPWALALATPPRQCDVTFARLPAGLMIDFGLVQHPETSDIWLLPTALLKDELKEAAKGSVSTNTAEANDSKATQANRPSVSDRKEPISRTIFPSVRITNSGTLIDMVSGAKSSGISKGMIRRNWKHPYGPLTKVDLKSLVWREDMPDYVLRAMRREVLRGLTQIVNGTAKTKKQRRQDTWTKLSITECPITQDGLEDSLRHLPELVNTRNGIVLILRNDDHIPEADVGRNENTTSSAESPDTDTSTDTARTAAQTFTSMNTVKESFDLVELPVQQSQVPVFDLTKLLSPDELQEVRQLGEVFEATALYFIPARTESALVVLDLWRLKSFFMERE